MNIYHVPQGWVSRSRVTSFFFFEGWRRARRPRGSIWATLMHIYHILIISQAFWLKCHMKIRPKSIFPCNADAELMKTSWRDSGLLVFAHFNHLTGFVITSFETFLTPSFVWLFKKGLFCSHSRVELEFIVNVLAGSVHMLSESTPAASPFLL